MPTGPRPSPPRSRGICGHHRPRARASSRSPGSSSSRTFSPAPNVAGSCSSGSRRSSTKAAARWRICSSSVGRRRSIVARLVGANRAVTCTRRAGGQGRGRAAWLCRHRPVPSARRKRSAVVWPAATAKLTRRGGNGDNVMARALLSAGSLPWRWRRPCRRCQSSCPRVWTAPPRAPDPSPRRLRSVPASRSRRTMKARTITAWYRPGTCARATSSTPRPSSSSAA